MEDNYPTLRRPKRKLSYIPNKKSTSNQWVGKLELEDIDKMFDDLEPSSLEEEDQVPQSLLLQISETGTDTNQTGRDSPSHPEEEGQLIEKVPNCQMEHKGDRLHPAMGTPSLKLDIDLDIPFEVHGPRKTSSPIEENVIVDGEVQMDNEKDTVMSPVLFVYADERKEEAETESLPTQEQQCNGPVAEQFDDFELESPPSKIALGKSRPSQLNKGEESCKEIQPAKEKASKKPHTADLKGKRKAQRQENTNPPMSAVRDEPEVSVPKKKSESAQKQPFVGAPARVGHDMTTFLQKLRDATQPKPSRSRKSLSPIKAPPPPEPEDNFLILEDDTPLWFSIPSKSATSKRPKRTSSNSKDNSDENGAKDSPIETEQKQQEAEQTSSKPGSQTVNQKMKKMKVKEKKNEVTEPGNDMGELCCPEEPPADDLMKQKQPNKNKRHKKASSKESDQAEVQPELCSPEEPPADDLMTQEKPDKMKRLKKASSKESDQAEVQPELCSPEEPPADDLMTQEKPDKMKRLKKASSKESDQAEVQPELCSPEEPPADDLMTQEKPDKMKRLKKASSKQSDQAEEQPELCSPEEPPVDDLMTQEKPDKMTRLKKASSKESDQAEEQPELCSPEEPPADDLMTQEKPDKMKRLKKASSKESDQAEVQPELCSPEEPPADDLMTQEKPGKMKRLKKASSKESDQAEEQPELCSPEEPPADDLMTQEKPDRKKKLKKASSKQSEQAEEQPKDTAMDEDKKPTLEKKAQISKSLKEGNENAKKSRAKSLKRDKKVPQESGAVMETVHVEAEKEQSQEPVDALSEKEIMNSETQVDGKNKQNRPLAVSEGSSSEDIQIPGKRKRRQPGQWWVSGSPSTEEKKVSNSQPTQKKSKQSKKEPIATVLSPVKTKKDGGMKRGNQPAPSPRQKTNKAKEKKTSRNRNRKTKGDTPDKVKTSEVFDTDEAEQIEEQEQEVLNEDSPLVFAHREHSQNTGDKVFQRVYHHVPNEKVSTSPAPVSPRGQREQLRSTEPEKRRRRPTSNWWIVNGLPEDVESVSLQPQQQGPKPRKQRKKQAQHSRSPGLGAPMNGNMVVSPKPLGGALVPRLKVKPLSATKTVKRSLGSKFNDIFTSVTPTILSSKETGQSKKRKVTAHPAVEVTVTDYTTLGKKHEDIVSMDAGESNGPLNQDAPEDDHCQSENTLKALRSGPSSMIELEQFEENDDIILPSNGSEAVLSASDLCAPPLKPLILQPKDKANLIEWFKSLWSTTIDNGPEISPDHFDWYFYQGRAIGLMVDVNGGSFCSGKILLGSYMKKPLWVDHSTTTVFNLLTSSVSVTINGSESRFSPGQSFMVQCGHAYSIQNITAQPAVLYFTRILAENLD